MGRHSLQDNPDIDYSKFDDRFDNQPQVVGPEWDELDLKQEEYIRNNAVSYKKTYNIPEIQGLEVGVRPMVPSTRRWYKRVTSFERNGFFNIWTHNLNVKLKVWLFYPTAVWGVTLVAMTGWYYKHYDHMLHSDIGPYSKLNVRDLPYEKLWYRPG